MDGISSTPVENSVQFLLLRDKYNFAGPGTKLAKRLKRGDKGINRLDDIALHHDIAYGKAKNLQDERKTDDVMIKAIDRLPGKNTMTEKIVKKIMQAKRKLKL